MHRAESFHERSQIETQTETKGSALVAVLWCFAILSVVTFSVLRTTQLDLRVAKNHGDATQAYYLALAGVEKAKALIYEQRKRLQQSGRSHDKDLLDNPAEFRDVRLGRGMFRVARQAGPEESSWGTVYGISDEESKLNVNDAAPAEIAKLPRMTGDVAAAIADWRDEDDNVTPEGAEQEYYASLRPPYRVSNAPLESVREMLMIRGVSPDLLLAEDWNANGFLDPEEDDGSLSAPPDDADGMLDTGWSAYLTVHSAVSNDNAWGKTRVNITSADAASLAEVDGISTDLANAIVAHRNSKAFESLADLLDVVAVREEERAEQPESTAPEARPSPNAGRARSPSGEGRAQPAPAPRSAPDATPAAPRGNQRTPQASGPKLISVALLQQIADDLTTESSYELSGRVNINTAGFSVLSCLPGASEDVARAIIEYRQQNGFFSNIAELLNVSGIDQGVFKQLSNRVTVRSETFRISSEGVVPSSGARKRIEAIVRMGDYEVETLYYREDP